MKTFCGPLLTRTAIVMVQKPKLVDNVTIMCWLEKRARTFITNFIRELYPDYAVSRQEVGMICKAFTKLTKNKDFASWSFAYGNGKIDNAVRSRAYRQRQWNGTVKRKSSSNYNGKDVDDAADELRKIKDERTLRQKFANSA